ncbi:MAG: B12-binding domain-containing radical SAM protein [Syntrophaceae bacterium]|nr:B12-binding domain-containing radical SAM protein [Syntrophaceae bacterium]
MKIILVVPTAEYRRNFFYRLASYIYGPSSAITGPLIIGGILKRAGHNVEVYQEFDGYFNPRCMKYCDLVGFYTITSNINRAYELADLARNIMGKRVIMGGLHASSLPEEALLHADQVIVGEAEQVILDVVEKKLTDDIIYAPPIKNIDVLPFPDYSILKTPCNAANILTTRGCPYSCSFCSSSKMFIPYRERSIENVIEEIRMYKKMRFKYLNFQDDNLTANKERIKKLLKKMISENLIFKETFFFGRADIAFDNELLELLRDARARRVLVGFESLNQSSHDLINKKMNVEDIYSLGDKLTAYKIKLIASIVLGMDTDGSEDIKKIVDHCININAYQLQPAILTPFPGTEIYKQLSKENRIFEKDWQFYDMMNVVFHPKYFTSAELQLEFFNALKKFYSIKPLYKILKIYGSEALLRRLGICIIILLSLPHYRITRKVMTSVYATHSIPSINIPSEVKQRDGA